MVCPCGHSGSLPETSGRFVCSECKVSIDLSWFEAPVAWQRWKLWRIRSGQVMAQMENRVRVEYREAVVV
jgi:hypothetical protein